MARNIPRKRELIVEKLLDLDQFGTTFRFKLPASKDNFKTGLGSAFTILLTLLLIFYGSLQMQRLVKFEETVVTMSVRDSHYTPDDTITTEDGLKFAFAITAYDSNREPIDDPRYGQVVAKIVSWG